MKEVVFTQAQFDRLVFAARNLYTSDIAESTVKALAELVQDWGEMKQAMAKSEDSANETTVSDETVEGE